MKQIFCALRIYRGAAGSRRAAAPPCRALRRLAPLACALLLTALAACSRPSVSPEEYLRFARDNARLGAPRPAVSLSVAGASGGYGRSAPDLRALLLKELNIGFLLERGAPALAARVLAVRRGEGYEQRELVFEGAAGAFRALLLLPEGGGSGLPAVIGLHGHGSSPEEFRDRYFGAALARSGFAVLLPEFRASGYDAAEQAVSSGLYAAGFTLMGLRVYEVLACADYLSAGGFSSAGRIGLFGHSMGSGAALLAARLGSGLGGLVIDNALPLSEGGGELDLHCETLPALAPYAVQINDVSTLALPYKTFTYDYPGVGDEAAVIVFFRAALGGGLKPPAATAGSGPGGYRPGEEYLRLEKVAADNFEREQKQHAVLQARAVALGRAYGLLPSSGTAEAPHAR